MGSPNLGVHMNLGNLHFYFQSWGKMLKPDQVHNFNRYVSKMLMRNRTIIVNGENGIEAIMFYFITDDVKPFANRPMWSTPTDQEEGKVIFIDKMVAHRWTKSVRLAVMDALEKKYPEATEAYWLREPKNRRVIVKLGGSRVYSQIS